MEEIRRSVCALDCPDACGVLVHWTGERATRLQGDPQHPVTRGFLCAKVTRYLERAYHSDRVLQPLRRTAAKGSRAFEPVSWDDALDAIAERLTAIAAEFGPESILPYSYAGTMGLLQGEGMDRRFFHRLGASRLDRTICAAAGTAGLNATLGARLGPEPQDFAHAKTIFAWGANIHGTNVHLWPFIVEARRNGAKLYTIDPIRTRTAELADRHFPIQPGTDLALALGVMHIVFREGWQDDAYLVAHTEGVASLRTLVSAYDPQRVAGLTGLSVEEIFVLARAMACEQPCAIRINYGLQRTDRGGSAVRAIAMLPALTGGWRHRGGGVLLSTSGAFQLNRAALHRPDLQHFALGREARLVNMSQLGHALLTLNDPPVRALVVYNSNPGAIAPNQNDVQRGLARPDLFTVVLDHFVTQTAAYADFILPATNWLEHTDLYYAYGHYYLQLARPALPAPGQTRSNVDIFRALAKRMGFAETCFDDTEEQMIDQVLASGSPYLQGIDRTRLEQQPFVRLNIDQPFLPFAGGGFGTSSAKCNLNANGLDYTPPVESRSGDASLRQRYPLELVSSKWNDTMNSTFSYRPELQHHFDQAWIHPLDAEARSIVQGDTVRLWNDRGSCQFSAYLTTSVRPGVVRVPSVRLPHLAADHRNVNVLTSERLTDIGGGATFYSCLIQVSRQDPITTPE